MNAQETQTKDDARYTFWVEDYLDNRIEWNGLKLSVARNMYSATSKNTPSNVLRFGWEQVRDTRGG